MKRKKKSKAEQNQFAIVPWAWTYYTFTESSQYTEKCYNGSTLIENECHIDYEDIKRKNMMVI